VLLLLFSDTVPRVVRRPNGTSFPSIQLQSYPRFRDGERRAGSSLLSALGRLGGLLGGSGLNGGLLGDNSGSGSLRLNTHGDVLSGNSLLLADVVLSSSGLSLVLEVLLTNDFSLGAVDLLNKNVLVLELVSLGGEVESVVHSAIDLLLVSVPLEQSTEHTEAAHPQDGFGHTGARSSLSLTSSLMTALALGLSVKLAAGARVGSDILSHDESVLHELSNVLACSMKKL